MTRSYIVLIAALSILCACGLGCDSNTSATEPAVQAPTTETVETVEVPAGGVEFDPAMPKEKIPDRAWYCDMGTVHYAAMEKQDGMCPVCGMELAHKGAPDEDARE
jgi:hypothetical protein